MHSTVATTPNGAPSAAVCSAGADDGLLNILNYEASLAHQRRALSFSATLPTVPMLRSPPYAGARAAAAVSQQARP